MFRITLADEKIKKESLYTPLEATMAHSEIGQNVREDIVKSGGVLPAKQPTPEKSVEEIARKHINFLKKKLMLDE